MYTRTTTNLLGTPSSPNPIAAAGQGFGTLTIATPTSGTSTSPDYQGQLITTVQIGSTPPTTSPTVQYEFSADGTTFVPDDRYGTFVVPIANASTSYPYTYVAPLGAVSCPGPMR